MNPSEFRQYFDAFDFQDIKKEDIHILNGKPMLDIVDVREYAEGKTARFTTRLHEEKLHYPFDFEQGKVYRHRNAHNRVMLYNPGQGA